MKIYCMREGGDPEDAPDIPNMIPPTITHSRPTPPRIKAKVVTPPLPLDPPLVSVTTGVDVGVA
jgi:hypothetical protein